MDNLIGAEAAEKAWAGLQIDLLQKYRAGHITPEHLEWFNSLRKEERDQLVGERALHKHFELIKMFPIEVPELYRHEGYLNRFWEQHHTEFFLYDHEITDENFPRATAMLTAGRKFFVKMFQPKRAVTTETCLAFLKTQKAVLVGARGIPLVYEVARDRLPVYRQFISFDEEDMLCEGLKGKRLLPVLSQHQTDREFYFYLHSFGGNLSINFILLCFCGPEHAGIGFPI